MNQEKVFQMKIKFLLFALVSLFTNSITLAQQPTDITLEIEGGVGGDPVTICRGTTIQINATITPPLPTYFYNWTNTTTGQNYNPWPVGEGGSGQGDEHSFIILRDLEQTSTIRLQVNGIEENITITVVDAPNPGTEGSVILCNKTGTLNLFDELQGTPAVGGTWTPPLSGGGGNFVVGIDTPGAYRYTIAGNAPCPDSEATVFVRECINTDFDNDGVPNNIDLDDDNDGILDSEENKVCDVLGTLTETRPIVDIDFGEGNTPTTDANVLGHNRSAIWPNDGFYNVGSGNFFRTSDNFEPWFMLTDVNPIPYSDGSGNPDGRYLAINIKNDFLQPIYRLTDIPLQNGIDYNFRIDMAGLCDQNCNDVPMLEIALIDQNLPAGSPPIFQTNSAALGVANDDIWRTLLLNFTGDRNSFLTLVITNQQRQGSNGNDLGIDNIRFAQLECDFDLDEIPNYLDLDSDNDGIFDIVEAGNPNVIDANNDGIADGPVGANGVPLSAGGGTNPVNSDGSEFDDYLDIDSDNDGIQDNIEGQGTFTYVAPSGNDSDQNGVDDVYDSANNPITPEDTDGDGTPDYLDLNSDDDCLTDNVEAYDLNQDGVADILPSGADTDRDGLDNNYDTVPLIPANQVTNPSDGNEVPTALPDNHNPGDDVDFRDEFEELLEEIELDFCSGQTATVNLFDRLEDMAIPGGTWTGPSVLGGGELGTFDPTTNAPGIYTYTLPIIGSCPERKAEVTISVGADPDTGEEGEKTFCETDDPEDLFDSLGGTPNTGGEWTPTLASGTGVFDPTVDPAGTYTYTIAFPGCASSSTDVEVTVNEAPDAGEDGDLDICESGTAVDLFTKIQGNPDTGGTWAPPLASGTGVFDPAVDAGGTYTYTVDGVDPCPDATSQIEVNLIGDPDAGIDDTITLCENSDSKDLLTVLGGTPDTGGVWTPTLASGTGTFDPSIDTAGTYTYTVSVAGCDDDTSQVIVDINTIPNAGEDSDIDICESGTAVDLFTKIQGNPDTGGTWTPALASGTGVFDPTVDAEGTYTYTVDGVDPCPNATSQIEVNLIGDPDAGINGAKTFCDSDAAENLFTFLGGTPNAGGIWTPVLASGTGVFDPSIDQQGIYTYTVTVAGCDDDTSEVTVGVNISPNAGTGDDRDICETDNVIDLFTILGDNPDVGGTWTPALTSGTGVFDPSIDQQGVYTYTINGPGSCQDDSAQVTINVINAPDAGADGTKTLCNDDDAIDLFDSLQGTPDMGGTWTPPLVSGTGIFNPQIDPPGPYTYTVVAIGCGEANSQAVVTVNPAVNAGENETFSTCDTGNAVDLFSLLGGTPDPTGTWTPPLASGTNIFDPAQDVAGTYVYTVVAVAPCLDDTASIVVDFDNTLVVIKPSNLRQCDDENDNVEAFDLEQQTPIIIADNLDYAVTYHISQPDADTGINPLNSPYNNVAKPQTIYARVREMSTGCVDTSINFDLELEDGVIANPDTYELCDDNMEFDGDPTNDSTVFNLASRDGIVLGPTQAPADFSVSYHSSIEDAENGTNTLISPYQNTINTQTIYARVENNTTFCFETSEVTLKVNPMPAFTLDSIYTICIGPDGNQVEPLPIINTGLSTDDYSFEWYLEGVLIAGEFNANITPVQIGNYSVIVTDNITGCTSIGINTMVIESAPPILSAQQISLTFVEDNTILATASNGNGSNVLYEFRLDDGQWLQNVPNDNTYTFEDVSAGEHIITARDLNGCGESSVTVLVIDYIRYFTPNSDGFHDTWNIIGIENQPDARIYIFNRFGKLLKQLSPTGKGWDGTYNNEILPTSDYWFTVDYREPSTDERKEFRAHFTLKR